MIENEKRDGRKSGIIDQKKRKIPFITREEPKERFPTERTLQAVRGLSLLQQPANRELVRLARPRYHISRYFIWPNWESRHSNLFEILSHLIILCIFRRSLSALGKPTTNASAEPVAFEDGTAKSRSRESETSQVLFFFVGLIWPFVSCSIWEVLARNESLLERIDPTAASTQ